MKTLIAITGTLCAMSLSTAHAATTVYTGQLEGVITSGTSSSSGRFMPETKISLIGRKVTIDFTTRITPDTYDLYNDQFYTNITNSDSVVVIPDAPIGTSSTTQSNEPILSFAQSADYSGDASNGRYSTSGYEYEIDFSHRLSFTFSNAYATAQALSGSGAYFGSFYNPFTGDANRGEFSFILTRGYVTGPGQTAAPVPEPATWTLLIAGFVLTGGALRRTVHRGHLRMA